MGRLTNKPIIIVHARVPFDDGGGRSVFSFPSQSKYSEKWRLEEKYCGEIARAQEVLVPEIR